MASRVMLRNLGRRSLKHANGTRRMLHGSASLMHGQIPPVPGADVLVGEGTYAGGNQVPYVKDLEATMVRPENMSTWPAFRCMDTEGDVVDGGSVHPDLDKDKLLEMYNTMLRLRAMDQVFYDLQRQGRISFYMTNSGEEGLAIGSSAALEPQDMVYGQYREAGVLMWRGFTVQQFADQCFSNVDDNGKGRQMPVHYGSPELNFQTISSPLATQAPQAAGAAYAFKQAGEDRCVICYLGDGSASEGDVHPAMNFAATLESPVIFFCRNNGFAISTPVKDQYRGDGIVTRGPALGIASMRVDGNDLFAVYEATREARRVALTEGRPVLIEAMTYRQSHHSTSDDSTRYRDIEEIKQWQETDDPVRRLRAYLEKQGWWDEEKEADAAKAERAGVLEAVKNAESKPKPEISDLFEDVYHTKPQSLIDQEEALRVHISKYPEHYSV
eukprot:g646.t1